MDFIGLRKRANKTENGLETCEHLIESSVEEMYATVVHTYALCFLFIPPCSTFEIVY